MTEQLALTLTPAARRADPESSHRAADRVTLSGKRGEHQRICLELVRRYPGRTSKELAELARRLNYAGLDRYAIARRLPELVPVHVRKVEPEGGGELTWWPQP